MSKDDNEKYFVSGTFDGHRAFYGPLKDIASVSLKTALDSSTLNGVLFINKSELLFRHALGSGSFGTVYKGLLFNEDVAIKCFKVDNTVSRLNRAISGVTQGSNVSSTTEQNDRQSDPQSNLPNVIVALEREVAILKSLSFPQIVQFVGISLDPAAIVTGYCEKGSLFDMIKYYRNSPSKRSEFPWWKRLKIACDAAAGMEYLHFNRKHPVLHGDLKTPNLLVDEDFNCYVADFNTSRFLTSDVMKASLVANNPYWLAPEVYYKDSFTKAVDVYPFGIIMWELLTLLLPFQNGDTVTPIWTVAISVSLKNARPIIPPNNELLGGPCPVYDEYCKLMKKCWSREEKERPDYRTIVEKLRKLWHKVHIGEQEKYEATLAKSPFDNNTTASLSRCNILSNEELEPVLETVQSGEEKGDIFRRMKLGSSKKFPSPFKQGPRSSVSSADAVALQEFTEQDIKGSSLHSPASIEHSFGSTTTEQSKTENSIMNSKTLQEYRDPHAEAQRRWGAIRSVLRLILDQSNSPIKPLEKTKTRNNMADSYQFERSSRKKLAQALVETMESEQSQQSNEESSSLKKVKGWGFIRETIFSDLGPTLHPAWDLLSGQNLSKLKLLRATTLKELDCGTNEKKQKQSGGGKWPIVRESFFGTNAPIERTVPPSWQKLLQSVFPFKTSQLKKLNDSTTEQVNDNETSKVEDQQNTDDNQNLEEFSPIWNMIQARGNIMDKHWKFLSNFMNESIGEMSPNENDMDGTGRWKRITKLMIVDGNGPSVEKWSFFRDWILSADLASGWNTIVAFVKERENPPEGKYWEKFRTLFFENRKIRDDVHWGFLKDLFLVDGEP
eukprot:g5651.t1